MAANSFGEIFRITTFGESHGAALGVVVDGCPAGVKWEQNILVSDLERRRPGQKNLVTSARAESDTPEILSGVFEEKTLGTPICMIVRNQDARSQDYSAIKTAPRAGHADDVWKNKFQHSDHRGGGRSSGRETVARVMGGAVAKMFIQTQISDLVFESHVIQVGHLSAEKTEDISARQDVVDLLKSAQEQGESYGGVISLRIKNIPPNLGQPVFHKLKSDLASAMMSIGATAAFDLGAGFESASMQGTVMHQANLYGGVRGGISTGDDLLLRVFFKPTSSILDVAKKGRHDPCIVIRAAVVVESMAALVIADHLLSRKLDHI